MDKKKIMIVEDEPVVAEDIRSGLVKAGFDVAASVGAGEEAVKIVLTAKPDLVLMDIHLSGRMDGIRAADWIGKHSDIPVIYLTAYSDEETIERAKATSPFGYVIKPFDRKELRTAIEMTLLKQDQIRKQAQRIDELEEKNRILQGEVILRSKDRASDVELGYGFLFSGGTGNLFYCGREVPLTKKERLFVSLLAENAGRTIPYGRIEDIVWGGKAGVDENTLRIFLWRLRSKIGKELIKNCVGVGYRIEEPEAPRR